MEPIMNSKKERVKLTPEQLFDIYLECNAPGAPVKTILARYDLRPWDLIAIRKKIRVAAMEALAHPGKQGRKPQVIPVEQYQRVSKFLILIILLYHIISIKIKIKITWCKYFKF